MSIAIKCDSCGGSNLLPEGKNTMFCAFCGNAIEKTITEEKKEFKSRIKSKPIITSPDIESYTNMGVDVSQSLLGNEFKRRVDDGYEVYNELTNSWEYFEDEYEELGGYKLSLKDKGIESLKEVTDWFTDDELESIKYLDLSNNNLTNLDGLQKFENAEIIDLKKNKITELNFLGKFKCLQVLNLSNNNITKVNGLFSNKKKVKSRKCTYEKYQNESLAFTIYIHLHNNNISEISDAAIKTMRQLLISDYVVLSLYNNPIISEIELKLTESLNPSVTLDELMDSEDSWFEGVSKYLKDSFEGGSSFSIKLAKESFIKWMTDFENDGSRILKILSVNIDEKNENYDFNCQLMYPPISQVKIALKNKTGYNPEDVKLGHCFIATATMGSYDHPKVMELRHFRDKWILTKNWGSSFVKWYYHYGEKAAKIIDKNMILKKISYLLIVKPLVYLSRIVKK